MRLLINLRVAAIAGLLVVVTVLTLPAKPAVGGEAPPLPGQERPCIPNPGDEVAPGLYTPCALGFAPSGAGSLLGAIGSWPISAETTPFDRWVEAERAYPLRRTAPAMAYDVEREVVVLFGGFVCPGVRCRPIGDMWEWDGGSWTLRRPTVAPPPTYGGSMVYDRTNHELVLFGGSSCGPVVCAPTAETWTYDGSSWSHEQPESSPPASYAGAMAYDAAREEVVLLAGCPLRCPGTSETWTWDGQNWTRRALLEPSPRYGAAMVFDAASARVLLFGGNDVTDNALSDTWAWDGSEWTSLQPETSPGPRMLAALAYDAMRGEVVLFGGLRRTCAPLCSDIFLNDLWRWNGATWEEGQAPAAPPTIAFSGVAYDAASENVVLFGGEGTRESPPIRFYERSTWTWDGETWSEHPSTVPEERTHPILGYDPVSRQTLLVGGFCLYETCGRWSWDGERWSEHRVPGAPLLTWYQSLVFHASTRTLVMYLGQRTWVWDGAEGTWTTITPPTSPPSRLAPAVAGDANGNLVLFGGQNGNSYLGDTWVWDGQTWTEMHPPTSPPGRAFASMVYDPLRKQAVLFGGLDQGGSRYFNDTWAWDGQTWTELTPATQPETRSWSAMAFDPVSKRIVMVAGISGPPNYQVLRDIWHFDGQDWIAGDPATAPVPRFGTGVAASPGGRLMLFGGQDGNPGRPQSDTWLWGDEKMAPAPG